MENARINEFLRQLRIYKVNNQRLLMPFLLLVLGAVLLAAFSSGFKPRRTVELQIVSWNVQAGRGHNGDMYYVGQTLSAIDADIIGLQELDYKCMRSKYRDQLRHVQMMTGLCNRTFAPSMQLQDGEYGIGTLTRSTKLALQSTKKWALIDRDDHNAFMAVEMRVALLSKLKVGSVDICHINTHLESIDANVRDKQLRVLLEDIEEECSNTNVVVAGDFSAAIPGKLDSYLPGQILIDAGFVDCGPEFSIKTYPATNATSRLSFVMLRAADRHVSCLGGRVLSKSLPHASNHLPITATLRVFTT